MFSVMSNGRSQRSDEPRFPLPRLDDAAVTLAELWLNAPTDRQLGSHPLVFITAYESAALSPAFYEGLVPYYLWSKLREVLWVPSA
jgi:hypothetical protein